MSPAVSISRMQTDTATYSARRDWLAAALRGDRPDWPASQIGAARDLLAVAEYEGVCALLGEIIRSSGVSPSWPSEFNAGLTAVAHQQLAIELLGRSDLIQVVQALAEAGIPMLVLKGTALAYSVYPAAHLRPRWDTDLLLPDTDAIERAKPVLAAVGYTASNVPTTTAMAYELSFHRDTPGGNTHWIDAHWALANNALYAGCFEFDELHAEAIALPALGDHARGLGSVHALLHACVHRVGNLPVGEGNRLIWLYDMDLLARRFSARDFDRLRNLSVQRGLAGASWDGLRNAVSTFATPLPDGLLDALKRAANQEHFDVRKAGRRWYQEWHNLRALPVAKRRSWAWEKLFPNPAYMRELYPVGNRWSLGCAYAQRLGHGLWLTLRGIGRRSSG